MENGLLAKTGDLMVINSKKHHRRSIRLHGYDYSGGGAYFVTICTHKHKCVFGEIVDGRMALNDAGQMVKAVWDDLPNHYPHVELDAFVVMPNHVHGIIVIVGRAETDRVRAETNCVRAGLKPAPTKIKRHGLPEIIRAWKTFSARRVNEIRNTPGKKFWHRNYFEHIIRNEIELDHLREYIINNPIKWECDRNHPSFWEHTW